MSFFTLGVDLPEEEVVVLLRFLSEKPTFFPERAAIRARIVNHFGGESEAQRKMLDYAKAHIVATKVRDF